jgi:hypothetical protein
MGDEVVNSLADARAGKPIAAWHFGLRLRFGNRELLNLIVIFHSAF